MANQQTGLALPRARGDVVGTPTFNRAMDALDRSMPGIRPPVQEDNSKPAALQDYGRQRFKIVSIQLDYLVCNPFDGTTQDTNTTVYVAKPPNVRGSEEEWNGVTYGGYSSDGQERVSTLSGNTEDEEVVRRFLVGEQIWATTGWVGGTGVTYTGIDEQEHPVEWMAESSGRMWAKQKDA